MAKVVKRKPAPNTPPRPAPAHRPSAPVAGRKWVVGLPHAPRAVVVAADEEGAWEAYKALCGITASDYQPKIERVTADSDLRVDEHGVVIEDRNFAAEAVDPDGIEELD